jgi:hypothetical protein
MIPKALAKIKAGTIQLGSDCVSSFVIFDRFFYNNRTIRLQIQACYHIYIHEGIHKEYCREDTSIFTIEKTDKKGSQKISLQ